MKTREHVAPSEVAALLGAVVLFAGSFGVGCAHLEGQSRPVRLDLLAFNDFHGNLEPTQDNLLVGGARVAAGGASYLAAHVAALRAKAEHSIVVSAGDLIGASPLLSALFHDEPTIEAMNRLGLDLNGVGNHEFDEGVDELLRMQNGGCHPTDGCQGRERFDGARFQFLAANVIDTRSGATLFPPYAIRSYDGVSVAFIGVTLEGTAELVSPGQDEGLEFLSEADTVNRLVEVLLEQGISAIVLLLHEGGFPASNDIQGCDGLSGPVVEIERRLHPEVDVIVSGHTHQAYICPLPGRLLTSGGSFGRILTHVEIEIDRASGNIVRAEARNRVVHHELEPSRPVESSIAFFRDRVRPLEARVVTTMRGALTRARNEAGVSSLGRVIADAQLEATREAGAEVAFMNAGGVRTAVAPVFGPDGTGDVTFGMLFAAQPFGNLLVTMDLSGADILALLEEQFEEERPRFLDVSANLTYAWAIDEGGRPAVVGGSARIDRAPIDPNRTYRVTANSYMASKGRLASGKNRSHGPVDLDALEAYLAARAPFSAPDLGGIELASRPVTTAR